MSKEEPFTHEGRMQQAAILVASGQTITDIAIEMKVSARSVYRWLSDPSFRTLVVEIRQRMLDVAVGRLADAACKAVDVLVELLADEKTSVKLRAAVAILENVTRLKEHLDFDQRILALENAYHASRSQRPVAATRTNGTPPNGAPH
jgi:hypothetical protein